MEFKKSTPPTIKRFCKKNSFEDISSHSESETGSTSTLKNEKNGDPYDFIDENKKRKKSVKESVDGRTILKKLPFGDFEVVREIEFVQKTDHPQHCNKTVVETHVAEPGILAAPSLSSAETSPFVSDMEDDFQVPISPIFYEQLLRQ